MRVMGHQRAGRQHAAHGASSLAFTLLEVMVACGIFFMVTFAILGLVAGTLKNARSLQRAEVDAGMAAAQVFQTLKTNKYEEGQLSGDFGEAYQDYTWEASWEPYQTNGLLQVGLIVHKRGNARPVDILTFWVFSPNAKSSFDNLGAPTLKQP